MGRIKAQKQTGADFIGKSEPRFALVEASGKDPVKCKAVQFPQSIGRGPEVFLGGGRENQKRFTL
jgi:hypothetical protein